MCFPNSERMYESAFELSEALITRFYATKTRKLTGDLLSGAKTTLGDGHDLTFGLHVYYAKSIFLCHFLGGDDYRGDYQRALELLEALGARAVAQFGEESQYTEDLVDFVNYARNNRLE